MSSTVPQPKGWPIVGNIFDIDPAQGIKSLDALADKYGQQMLPPTIIGRSLIVDRRNIQVELFGTRFIFRLLCRPC